MEEEDPTHRWVTKFAAADLVRVADSMHYLDTEEASAAVDLAAASIHYCTVEAAAVLAAVEPMRCRMVQVAAAVADSRHSEAIAVVVVPVVPTHYWDYNCHSWTGEVHHKDWWVLVAPRVHLDCHWESFRTFHFPLPA